jgi:hypothetical protein
MRPDGRRRLVIAIKVIGWTSVVVCTLILLVLIALPAPHTPGAANAAATVGTMRRVNDAIKQEISAGRGVPVRIADMRQELDEEFRVRMDSGERSGYRYQYRRTSPTQYTISAEPAEPGRTGTRCFFTDETEVIRGSRKCPATANSDPVYSPGNPTAH